MQRPRDTASSLLTLRASKFHTTFWKFDPEHIVIDTDELDTLVDKLKASGINFLEETSIGGGRRVCFFEGTDGVQLEFIEMKR